MRHAIDEATALAMVKRHRARAHGWHFDRAIVDAMLAQPNAAGIRIYLGVTEKGQTTPILMATNASGDDLTAVIAEEATPCPPFCATGPFA